MREKLRELDGQVKCLFADLMTFLGYVSSWPTAPDCIKPGTYDVDDELLAARPPLDISATFNKLQKHVDHLKRQWPLLEKFERDIPLEWIPENKKWHELSGSMPSMDFLNEVERRPNGNLHTAIVDGAARCLMDLHLAKTVETKCHAADRWHEALGVLTQGDSVWRRLHCEVLAGASNADVAAAAREEVDNTLLPETIPVLKDNELWVLTFLGENSAHRYVINEEIYNNRDSDAPESPATVSKILKKFQGLRLTYRGPGGRGSALTERGRSYYKTLKCRATDRN